MTAVAASAAEVARQMPPWLVAEGHKLLARKSLRAFMKHCWQTSSEKFVEGRHTIEITNALDEAVERYARGLSSYVLIDCPIRHGKSDIFSRFFPPYLLGRFPDMEIILQTGTADLAEGMSADARAIMRCPEYAQLFPNSTVSKASSSVKRWGLEGHRGKLKAAGLGGSIMGKGAGAYLLDDYFATREDAENPNTRQKFWESFTSNSTTRMAPVHIMVIGATRWNIDDFHGRILKMMEADPKYPRFNQLHYKARQDDGTYLFPERYPDSWYEMQFAMKSEYESSALLQGEPTLRGGNMIRTDSIVKLPEMPKDLLWVRSWDLASTEKERAKDDPDWTAGVKLAVTLDDAGVPSLYIDDIRRCQAEAPERDRLIMATHEADGPACWIGVESVAGYKDTFTTLSKVLKGRAVVHKITVSRDPVVRVGDIEPVFESGRVYMRLAGWNDNAIAELGAFPAATHDDQVHAIANGYLLALERARAGSTFGGQVGQGAVG